MNKPLVPGSLGYIVSYIGDNTTLLYGDYNKHYIIRMQIPIQQPVHPWRLTWNIIMEVWFRSFSCLKRVICRFHVNLPGCIMAGVFFVTPLGFRMADHGEWGPILLWIHLVILLTRCFVHSMVGLSTRRRGENKCFITMYHLCMFTYMYHTFTVSQM